MSKNTEFFKKLTVFGLIVVAPVSYASQLGEAGLSINTLGVGAEYSHPIMEYVSGRFGVNFFNYDRESTKSGIDYDVTLEFRTFSGIVDWSPFQSSFYVSGGLIYNGNKFSGEAKPTKGTFKIGDVTYKKEEIGSASGDLDFNKVAPYVGIGWKGSLAELTGGKRLSLAANLGAMYHGKPDATFTATCGPALTGKGCAELQDNVAKEQRQLEDEVENFRWYPVASISIKYDF